VVGVIELVTGDEPALVMEWIDGIELGKLVRAAADKGRRLPVDVVAAIGRDMLAGLHAAHESRRDDGLALDIVHRDVSPQNVLVGFDGSTRITDFGVAKAAWRQQHTEDGSIKGKLRYLAPEQLTGSCDRRADVYGVGAVMWELLTGTRMRAGDGVEMLVEILCAQVQAPSVSSPEAACLDAVVMQALERSPDQRFATAAEMLAAIERCVTVASPARVAAAVAELVAVAVARPAHVEAVEMVEELVETVEDLSVACVSAARVVGRARRASLRQARWEPVKRVAGAIAPPASCTLPRSEGRSPPAQIRFRSVLLAS
jgi:serine/threonine-protein kinase